MSDQEFEAWAQGAVRGTLDKLQDSAVFLGIMTTNFEKDALAVLQFGLAVLIDKPIYLVVKKGTYLPENVKRLARGIEEYIGPDDIGPTTKKLLQIALKNETFS